jgi:hypothetical protein
MMTTGCAVTFNWGVLMIYALQCDNLFDYMRGNHQTILVQVALNFEARLDRLPKVLYVRNSLERRVKINVACMVCQPLLVGDSTE